MHQVSQHREEEEHERRNCTRNPDQDVLGDASAFSADRVQSVLGFCASRPIGIVSDLSTTANAPEHHQSATGEEQSQKDAGEEPKRRRTAYAEFNPTAQEEGEYKTKYSDHEFRSNNQDSFNPSH